MKKKMKKIITLLLAMVICCGIGNNVYAAEKNSHLPEGWKRLGNPETSGMRVVDPLREPAAGLSSLTITDLALDDNNEVHIEVKVMGTARSVLCWCDGTQCQENITESVSITSGNRVIGEYRYFHTGIYYDVSLSGKTLDAEAEALNAVMPWNTLTASRVFTFP